MHSNIQQLLVSTNSLIQEKKLTNSDSFEFLSRLSLVMTNQLHIINACSRIGTQWSDTRAYSRTDTRAHSRTYSRAHSWTDTTAHSRTDTRKHSRTNTRTHTLVCLSVPHHCKTTFSNGNLRHFTLSFNKHQNIKDQPHSMPERIRSRLR